MNKGQDGDESIKGESGEVFSGGRDGGRTGEVVLSAPPLCFPLRRQTLLSSFISFQSLMPLLHKKGPV